ncbi:hypothetical protein C8J57DRAFT_324481 [Mycena rebaudengoi]|nr:hypothetical protein C8J57DRAFT_324481 [Mycena rebaudengoi]
MVRLDLKWNLRAAALTVGLFSVLACFIQGCSQLPPAVCRIYHWKNVGALSYSDLLLPLIARRIFPGFYSSAFSSEDKRARFENTFATVRKELLDSFAAQGLPEDAKIWYARNIDYIVPGGKLNRGMSVVDTVEVMKGRPLSEIEYLQVAVRKYKTRIMPK